MRHRSSDHRPQFVQVYAEVSVAGGRANDGVVTEAKGMSQPDEVRTDEVGSEELHQFQRLADSEQ